MDYQIREFEFNFRILQKFLESRILLCCVISLLVLKILAVGVSINFPNNIFFADITKIALENMTNQARQASGLPVLAENLKLQAAAKLKAEDMIKNAYFSHTSPTGLSPWYWFSEAGYNYKYAGENLAIGFYDSSEVFNAWFNSDSHKANILNPNYREVGTAVLGGFGQQNTIIVVQMFGSQAVIQKSLKNPESKFEPEPEPKLEQEVEFKPEVLSQQTSTEASLERQKSSATTGLFYQILNFDYTESLQDVIYAFSFLVIAILLSAIFFSFNVPIEKKFVFRAILLLGLLTAASALSKSVITLIIPHQVII